MGSVRTLNCSKKLWQGECLSTKLKINLLIWIFLASALSCSGLHPCVHHVCLHGISTTTSLHEATSTCTMLLYCAHCICSCTLNCLIAYWAVPCFLMITYIYGLEGFSPFYPLSADAVFSESFSWWLFLLQTNFLSVVLWKRELKLVNLHNSPY